MMHMCPCVVALCLGVVIVISGVYVFFFFKDTATTEIYTYGHTLSLHDALPISSHLSTRPTRPPSTRRSRRSATIRSEEHTSELQSLMRISYAVFCLNKKNKSGLNGDQFFSHAPVRQHKR